MFIVVLDLSVLRFTIPIKVTHICEFCLLINIFTSYASTSVPLKVNSCLRITFQVIIYRISSTWIWMNLRQDDGCLAIWPRTNNPIEKVWGHFIIGLRPMVMVWRSDRKSNQWGWENGINGPQSIPGRWGNSPRWVSIIVRRNPHAATERNHITIDQRARVVWKYESVTKKKKRSTK